MFENFDLNLQTYNLEKPSVSVNRVRGSKSEFLSLEERTVFTLRGLMGGTSNSQSRGAQSKRNITGINFMSGSPSIYLVSISRHLFVSMRHRR